MIAPRAKTLLTSPRAVATTTFPHAAERYEANAGEQARRAARPEEEGPGAGTSVQGSGQAARSRNPGQPTPPSPHSRPRSRLSRAALSSPACMAHDATGPQNEGPPDLGAAARPRKRAGRVAREGRGPPARDRQERPGPGQGAATGPLHCLRGPSRPKPERNAPVTLL